VCVLVVAVGAIVVQWLLPIGIWSSVVVADLAAGTFAVAGRAPKTSTALTTALERLAMGDSTVRLDPGDGVSVEVCAAIEALRRALEERKTAEATRQSDQDSGLEKSRKRMTLLLDFDTAAGSMLETVTGTMSRARGIADTLRRTSDITEHRSADLARDAEQANSNIQAVASATEELTTSQEAGHLRTSVETVLREIKAV